MDRKTTNRKDGLWPLVRWGWDACAFTFRDGKVHFKNAYVRTPKYVKETEQQQILYKGFGTKIPGGIRANFLKAPANPANTSAMYHGGKLLALNEGGRPWQIEPAT